MFDCLGWKERKGYVLFKDALNSFYLRLYDLGHMVKDHSDSERKPADAYMDYSSRLAAMCSFICIIPQTG